MAVQTMALTEPFRSDVTPGNGYIYIYIPVKKAISLMKIIEDAHFDIPRFYYFSSLTLLIIWAIDQHPFMTNKVGQL